MPPAPGLALPRGLCLGATEVFVPPPDATEVVAPEAATTLDAGVDDALAASRVDAPLEFPLLTGNCCCVFFLIFSFHFLVAWLPLSLFGTLSDANIHLFGYNGETNTIVFMTFHLLGMSSACADPIIYGYRNKHLRRGNYIILKRVNQYLSCL